MGGPLRSLNYEVARIGEAGALASSGGLGDAAVWPAEKITRKSLDQIEIDMTAQAPPPRTVPKR